MDKINTESNRNFILKNYINNPSNVNNNKIMKEKYKSYYDASNSIKTNKNNYIFYRNRNNNDVKNSLYSINNNLNLLGNFDMNDKDRIVNKVNHFQVRLNLISMK